MARVRSTSRRGPAVPQRGSPPVLSEFLRRRGRLVVSLVVVVVGLGLLGWYGRPLGTRTVIAVACRRYYGPANIRIANIRNSDGSGEQLMRTDSRGGTTGRRLPTFLLIGAMKAGTTSLYHYLSAHPQVVTSRY